MAMLTLQGLYNYDSRLFDLMKVPKQLNVNTVIRTLCDRTRELELLYPELTYMKQRIGIWSDRNQWTWQKMCDVLEKEYDPIENYDRTEEWSDQNQSTETSHDQSDESNGFENVRTDNLKEKNSGTNRRQNVAFNSGLTDAEKNIVDGVVDNTGTQKHIENGHKNTVNDGDKSGNSSSTHTGRIHGNIGVTTTQQMIQSELELAKFNIYETIADSFVQEFCLMVY